MSGSRFARTGRCRFLVCLGILVLMVGMVALFHSSQVQLDETREQRLHCEQQQEALNERLTTLVEQKYHLEKNQERERNEQLETKRNLEQKIKELEDKFQKEQAEKQIRYDKLQQSHKLLQGDHKHLKEESQKTNKQQLDDINGLEKKIQSVRSELQKEKSTKSGELYECRTKYSIAEQEKKRLEDLLSSADGKQQLHTRIMEMEQSLKDCQTHCNYKAIERKPVGPKPDISPEGNAKTSEKSFKHQDPVSEGVYHIAVNPKNYQTKTINNHKNNGEGETSEPSNAHVGVKNNLKQLTTKQSSHITFDTNSVVKPLIAKHFNGSLILNSVENFQIVPKTIKRLPDDEQQQQEKPNQNLHESDKNQVSPLSAPKNKGQLASTATSKSEQQVQAASALNATSANIRTARGSSSSSNSPPLALPPNHRKLPDNVAPIPDHFEDLLLKSNNDQIKSNNPSHLEETKHAINNNYDSGAHEINNNEGDSQQFQHENDLNNLFDNNKNHKDLNNDKDDDIGNDDDDNLGADNDGVGGIFGGAAAGDIAVKHNQQQLLDNNLKNEIADDQGKEFGDGLRLEEGAIEEDDDDDYSNPSHKQAGGQAIRN